MLLTLKGHIKPLCHMIGRKIIDTMLLENNRHYDRHCDNRHHDNIHDDNIHDGNRHDDNRHDDSIHDLIIQVWKVCGSAHIVNKLQIWTLFPILRY